MPKIIGLTGNEAAAEAMRQINPDVVAAYPITPQTELMHKFADYVADGAVDTELVLVESEHSALSAAVGAAAAGARAMTATSSQGLALMFEILHIAAGLRLPIVMAVVNRALSAPINIHCDHSDTMNCRDAGWIQFYAENSQEAYDAIIMGVRIAEHPDVRLPLMVCLDGFILSHTLERIEVLDDEVVQNFVGEYKPERTLLDVDHPITVGALYLPDHYFEHKMQEALAQLKAYPVIREVAKGFTGLSGRSYDFIEKYHMEDAERAVIALGSTAGTAKDAVDELRAQGEKVGLIKISFFRPFPYEDLVEALKPVKALAVMDRAIAFGSKGGPVYTDIRSALYDQPLDLKMVNYIYGLGGRDVSPEDIKIVFDDLKTIVRTGEIAFETTYLGVREDSQFKSVHLVA